MKPEDMYDGVTNIRDDLIENAKKPKKRKLWPAAVAAALAAAVALGGVAALRSGNGGPVFDGGGKVVTLASAVYPKRPAYAGDGNGEGSAYEAWREALRERRLDQEEREALDTWERAMIPALLSGDNGENAVCSPVSLYLALGMLAEATDGASRQQILDALGADSLEALRSQANRVWNALYNDDGSYTLSLGSSIWLRDDYSYEKTPLERMAESYYASAFSGEMGSAEYNEALQKWLNDNTGGLLEEAVDGVELKSDTALALATTVLFKDKWAVRFNPGLTKTGVFHAPSGDVEREFMFESGLMTYYWADKFCCVRLEFESAGVMALLLPDEGVTVEEVLADPAAVALLAGTVNPDGAESEYLRVNLTLPKFDVTQDGDIGERVRALGITEAFDQWRADFSPIMGDGLSPENNVYLSKVLHGARVTVDEKGCVGAAYTVMVANAGAMPPPDQEVDMVLDRPFLFSVLSEGVPVFAGIVNDP